MLIQTAAERKRRRHPKMSKELVRLLSSLNEGVVVDGVYWYCCVDIYLGKNHRRQCCWMASVLGDFLVMSRSDFLKTSDVDAMSRSGRLQAIDV